MTDAAIERSARAVADALARGLAERAGSPFEALDLAVRPADDAFWTAPAFPAVVVSVPLPGAAPGESLLVLEPADARALAELADAGDLGEDELAAIASAFARLLAGGATATARLATDATEVRALAPDTWAASYRLAGDGVDVSIIQTFPAAPAVADAGDGGQSVPGAVTRACAISADTMGTVLSELFSEEVSTTPPVIGRASADATGTLDLPVVLADVSYVAGLGGSTQLILRPGDAALLAAAMMGTPETTGDGLSPIELSAVSEALNQVMSATVDELSRVLGTYVEASPPTCVAIDSPDALRERAGDVAYRARVDLASTGFGAAIVQFVSTELADSLASAFADVVARADADPFGDLADVPADDAFLPAAAPPEARAPAREMLSGIRVRVSAELGRARLPIARVANLPEGSVVMLDRAPTDPVDVLVNGTPFAQARVVLVDGEYAVQILSLSPVELGG